MSAAIPAKVYAAIAERLDPMCATDLFGTPSLSGPRESPRIEHGAYKGPLAAAEFLHAVREPLRAWLQDDRNVIVYVHRLSIFHRDYTSREYEGGTLWRKRTCTPEQQVRALAAALGIEVGE